MKLAVHVLLIDFSRSSWRALDVTAARGAGIPSIFSRHEKATNASQAFEKGSGSSLLVTLTTYSMILWCTTPVAASYILLHQKATAHTILKTFAGPYTARRDLSKNATKLFSTP